MSNELPLNLADWDEDCMQEFIRQNSSSFYVFASRYVEDKEAIGDFLQEAYLKLWSRRESIGAVKSPRNYFFSILRNTIIDNYNHFQQNPQEKDVGSYTEIADETLVDHLIETESSYLIAQAIQALSPQSRQVILLSMQGESLGDIAEALQISINSVKTVKYRALKQLSKRLSREDFLLLLFLLSL